MEDNFSEEASLLGGSPLGGRWVAGLMIEGEATPPLQRGVASSSIGKAAGWVGGCKQTMVISCKLRTGGRERGR